VTPVLVGLVLVAAIGAMVIFAIVPAKSRGSAEYTASVSELPRLLKLLKEQKSSDSLIAIQGPSPREFFEFRFVHQRLVLEYQIVEPIQLENEAQFDAAAKRCGASVDHWADGSDGWDKYIYAELGGNASEAANLAQRILKEFSGLTNEVAVTVRLQDFTSDVRRMSNESLERTREE